MTEQEAAVDYGGKARAVTSMPPNAAAGGQSRAGEAGANLTAVLADQRATAQAQLDDAMAALQRYSRIKGVRKSDIARASLGPALLKKRLDDIDARIAAAND